VDRTAMLAPREGSVAEALRAREEATPDEIALARGARRGDRGAFDARYERWFAPIYAYASRHSQGPAAAEALAERIWLAVIDALDDYPGEPRLGAWLHAIARRASRSTRGGDSLPDR
jgi:DNA-directed RNA polymerase specialized sigma24 family protein